MVTVDVSFFSKTQKYLLILRIGKETEKNVHFRSLLIRMRAVLVHSGKHVGKTVSNVKYRELLIPQFYLQEFILR